jgi:hypothetical protein
MPKRIDISLILILLGVGSLFTGEASAQEMGVTAPNHEQTLRALVACGVRLSNIRITYEDEFQSDVVAISDLGGTDEARIGCVKTAVPVDYIVLIEAGDQRYAYYAEDRVHRVPERLRSAVATRLARIAGECGLSARALRLNAGEIRLRPSPDTRYEVVDCALTRLKESGLLRHMPMGFVGNETHDTGNQQ